MKKEIKKEVVKERMDSDSIREIGIWSLRILLVVGAVVSGCMGHKEISSGCVTGLICSFIFL